LAAGNGGGDDQEKSEWENSQEDSEEYEWQKKEEDCEEKNAASSH